MENQASSRALQVSRNISVIIRRDLDRYSEALDKVIRSNLILYLRECIDYGLDIKRFWPLIDLLTDYEQAKLEKAIDLTWQIVFAAKGEKNIVQKAIADLYKLCQEKSRLRKIYFRAAIDLSDSFSLTHQVALMNSVVEQELLQSEVRFMKVNYNPFTKEATFKFHRIMKDDPKRDMINLSPLPELAEDDYIGAEMRDMGFVSSWPWGYVVIGDWVFRVIETEEHQYGVPWEKIISKFGGCPFKPHNQGFYNYRFKSCHCSMTHLCIAFDLLSAGTLGALAEKLLCLYETRNLRVFPEFKRLKKV